MIDTSRATLSRSCSIRYYNHRFVLEEVSHIFTIHIHRDHSGCGGILIKEMPRTKVLAYPRASYYPPFLISNAEKFLGEKWTVSFSELLPVPASRVKPVNNGEVIDLGNEEKLGSVTLEQISLEERVFYNRGQRGYVRAGIGTRAIVKVPCYGGGKGVGSWARG